MSRTHPCRVALALAVALTALALAPAAAQQQEPPTHLVQISLLAASKKGPDELADLPENTRLAIEDVRRFLPFKSYRLLDTALLRVHRGARTSLKGPADREFSVALNLDGNQQAGKLLVRAFELVEKRLLAPPAAGAGDKVAPPAPTSRTVMSSSFAAEVGQTVVVGTSRLNGGDEALMVLFTALP